MGQPLENSLPQPSSKWVPFMNQGRIRQQRVRDGLYYQLFPRYCGTLIPTAPTAIRLWETFTFQIQSIIDKTVAQSIAHTLIRLLFHNLKLIIRGDNSRSSAICCYKEQS